MGDAGQEGVDAGAGAESGKKGDAKHAVREIRPVWDPPQCGAKRQGKYANDTPSTDRRCKHNAAVEIDNVFLCRKHAGQLALQILLEEYRND